MYELFGSNQSFSDTYLPPQLDYDNTSQDFTRH